MNCSVSSFSGAIMTARCLLRLASIVFMAMAAMLLMAGDAAAGLSGSAARNCCKARRCTPGCCKVDRPSPARLAGDPALTETASDRPCFSAPAASCECRSSEPAAPASKSESRPSPSRPDRIPLNPASSTIETPSASAMLARLAPHAIHSPGDPLYLRTSRLLI
jgi:hypothetical protein